MSSLQLLDESEASTSALLVANGKPNEPHSRYTGLNEYPASQTFCSS